MRVVKCGKELVVSFHKHSQCTSGEPQRSGGESGAKRPGQLRPGSLFLVGSVQPIFSFKKLFDPQGRLPYVCVPLMPPHQLLFEQARSRAAPDVFLNGKPPGAGAPSKGRTRLRGPTPAPGSLPPCSQNALVRFGFKTG